MSLQPKASSVQSGILVFQKVNETAMGGFTIDKTGITGVIAPGSLVFFDEGTRIAKILKTAEVSEAAGGSATDYKVKKRHNFAVGDFVARTVGGAAFAITAINRTNAGYDVITVGTTLGAAAAGSGLFHSSATGASAAALNVTPNGLSYDEYTIGEDDSMSVVVDGTVYSRRINPVPSQVASALKKILFSNAY